MNAPRIPDHPFTAREAETLGISRAMLRALLATGAVKQLLHGVYVPGSWPDTPGTRGRALAHVAPQHTVVVDRSASSMHGIDVLEYAELDVPPDLEVASIGGATATRRDGVLGGKRDLLPTEVMTVNGVRITTPIRTMCDVACLRGRHRAFATLEAYRTKFGLTTADLAAMLPRYYRRRGSIQLKELSPLARRGVDSQPESWIGIDIYDEGYPMPAAQVWVYVPGWGLVRVENAYEHLRIAVEYDGEEHHTLPGDVAHDGDRREALRVDGDWKITVVRKDGFSGEGRERWQAEFAEAYAERAPDAPRKRIYARGPDLYPGRRRRGRT